MQDAASQLPPYRHPLPGPWMLRAIWTGKTPELPKLTLLEIRRKFRELGRRHGQGAQLLELERMDRLYDGRKASGLDNSQKSGLVMTNLGVIIAAVAAFLLSREVAVLVMGLLAVLAMAAAILLANLIFAPKAKNWEGTDVGCRALDSLCVALGPDPLTGKEVEKGADGGYNGIDLQLENHYLDSVTGFHHWDQLVLLERREFNQVCWLSNGGIVLTVLAVLTAGILNLV